MEYLRRAPSSKVIKFNKISKQHKNSLPCLKNGFAHILEESFMGCSLIANPGFEGRGPSVRARLNQQWAQGLMCIRATILYHPENLKI